MPPVKTHFRDDSGFAPSQWEPALLYNDVSHWLGASLESVLKRLSVSSAVTCLVKDTWKFIDVTGNPLSINRRKTVNAKVLVLSYLHSVLLQNFNNTNYWGAIRNSDLYALTHWGRDKMAAISQTTFSSAFSWMKIYEFRLRFRWSLFLRFELTIFQYWFR